MSRRDRKKTKLPPGKFIPIPVTVLKAVMGKLSATELRVWLALCAQSQHWSNGTAKLCRSVVSEYHLGSWTTVTAATKKLMDAGFIVRTRKARPRHCALYGVTHIDLNGEAMLKENASEPVPELATDSCSESHATGAVASDSQNCSELPPKGPDSLQRLYRKRPKKGSDSLQVLYQSKTLPSALGISAAHRARQADVAAGDGARVNQGASLIESQQHELIIRHARATPEWSDTRIAAVLKVAVEQVTAVREQMRGNL